ncbi:MAG: DUF4914 family protein [bacterium]|jgi:hypothetical protein
MDLSALRLSSEIQELLAAAPEVQVANKPEDLLNIIDHETNGGWFEVAYDVPGDGRIVEARVCKVRNGIAVNYTDPYMRRRDPDCMFIGDEFPTNKPRFVDRFGQSFDHLRRETIEWLKTQKLLVFFFVSGQKELGGLDSIVITPANTAFFAYALGLLQDIVPVDQLDETFSPKVAFYIAPPFRNSFFQGRQAVVHNRREEVHELFCYNLYPGPSAKKGIYGVLINTGEKDGWITTHCSTVQVITPYDNRVTIMHEGASGGGKSEMLEQIHRERDGRLLIGHNILTKEKRYLTLPRGCELKPVTDDMALCPPSLQNKETGKLVVTDAENAWFVRVNHITEYGVDPHLERLTANPPSPILFLNIDAVPNSRALIWEHIEDEPGVRCPNPRVILPRNIVPGVVNSPVTVDIRSFGVRTPPCTREEPSYGIIGMFHILPPALAWLWRLTSPRGYANPSIVESDGLTSEGVGSYWPFATGRRVDQANLLLEQILSTPETLFILCPNQHIGAWKVGFMPQWITREYLARRGHSKFGPDQVNYARTPILGYTMDTVHVEGTIIGHWFLQVETQPEIGTDGYDAGAKILYDFFREQLAKFNTSDLLPEGKRIIECCMDYGNVQDYEAFCPTKFVEQA